VSVELLAFLPGDGVLVPVNLNLRVVGHFFNLLLSLQTFWPGTEPSIVPTGGRGHNGNEEAPHRRGRRNGFAGPTGMI
jgi:hypothetical protein